MQVIDRVNGILKKNPVKAAQWDHFGMESSQEEKNAKIETIYIVINSFYAKYSLREDIYRYVKKLIMWRISFYIKNSLREDIY